MDCYCILIKGIVQGVGFRPFVYNLAQSLNINGFVTNSSEGVIIEVEGGKIERFIQILQHNPPPLSRIDSISIRKIGFKKYKDFKIIHSISDGTFTHISPDISICKDCLKELFDPTNKKYLYPFINCTNCGPRYTITQKVPYDRPNTTMAVFKMCLDCQKEYDNPLDRRFHAQPNACPQCGPQLELKIINQQFKKENNQNPIDETISLLRQGAIVAIKGLGGFHLCADALNSISVAELRQRKRRRNKPFAIMSPDIETIKNFCLVSKDEETILQSSQRPIVLLKKRDSISLSDNIAPKNKELGFMMPYTPLHYLLFYKDIKKQNFSALIMTSGNISEEPIVIDNEDAISRLSCIADAFLLHNRDIFMRVDDSVVRVFEGDTLFIRRGRGYSPLSVNIKHGSADILATGADIKNSFTITKDNSIIMSQYIGDMENLETLNFFEETLANLQQVYRANPQYIVYDMHPAYMSTQWALKKSQKENIKSYAIQHHYAHILSVMAENNLKDKVIGIAFDGTGYGIDGNIWGSEFFVCDIDGFERFAHFKYIPLPGGDMAIKECYRTAISLIRKSLNDRDFYKWMDNMDFVKKQGADKISNILNILDNKNFSPLSSGSGRLFDAVSSILSICDINTFEGEAAIALESLLDENMNFDSTQAYPFEVTDTIPAVIDFSKMVIEILEDIGARNKGVISNRFHNTIIKNISFIVQKIRDKYNINEVVLSGGVFQNRYILRNTIKILTDLDYKVYFNKIVPCNDAGISLGQCYVLAERLREKK